MIGHPMRAADQLNAGATAQRCSTPWVVHSRANRGSNPLHVCQASGGRSTSDIYVGPDPKAIRTPHRQGRTQPRPMELAHANFVGFDIGAAFCNRVRVRLTSLV